MAPGTRPNRGSSVFAEEGTIRSPGLAESIRELLPVAVLIYALLGEPWASAASAAAWLLALFAETWIPGRAGPHCLSHAPVAGFFNLRRLIPFGAVLTILLAVFLSAEMLRGGLPVRAAVLDSIQSALFCSVLLIPLGLPLAAVFLKRGKGKEPGRGAGRTGWIAAFQISCCAGMSLATAGSTLAGWLPPLTLGQMLWVNAVGTVPPSLALGLALESPGASAGTNPGRARLLPDILVPGFLSAILLLMVYRLSLGYAGDAPRAVERARSLGFLALGLVQAGISLTSLPGSPEAGRLRFLGRPLWIRLGGSLAALACVAAAFWAPPLSSALGLILPKPGEAAGVSAGVAAYAVLDTLLRARLGRVGLDRAALLSRSRGGSQGS